MIFIFSLAMLAIIYYFIWRCRTSIVERGARSGEERRRLQKMLLSLIEKADFLVEDDLNALMSVLPDKDKLLLKVSM